MKNWGILLAVLLGCATSGAATVSRNLACPKDKLETCRWDIQSKVSVSAGIPTVVVDWSKSVVSRHREKPYASPLQCNVDRSFDETAGGYIQVWFEGEKVACNPMRRNPADCGVKFLLDDPKDFHSAAGFTVTAPVGKTLQKVEHYSTLDLQCGDFTASDFAQAKWKSVVGWEKNGFGDGTYSRGSAP
jgi:hypothetical protein